MVVSSGDVNKPSLKLLASAALSLILVGPSCQELPPDQAQRPTAPIFLAQASFRITFGLGDKHQNSWDGGIQPSDGQELVVEPDRFRVHLYKGLGDQRDPNPEFPNDYVRPPHNWVCSTRNAWMRSNESPPQLEYPSILLHIRQSPAGSPVKVSTTKGDFSFDPSKTITFVPRFFLDQGVRVERIPSAAPADSQQLAQQDFPSILAAAGDLWVAWQEYRDHSDTVCVRRRTDEEWEDSFVLTEKADVFGTALGQDSMGKTWAIWSMQSDGNWDLYGRAHAQSGWSKVEQITSHPGPDTFHRITTDASGRMWLVWQRSVEGRSQIFAKNLFRGTWSDEIQISEGSSSEGNNWNPSLAAGTSRQVAVVWDGYAAGNYDVYLRRFIDGRWGAVQVVAGTPRYEANPSVAVDGRDRTWVAWQESGVDWGKDTGQLVTQPGIGLHEPRSIRVVCFDGEKMMAPSGAVPAVFQGKDYWGDPVLQIGPSGYPWLFLRHMAMRIPDSLETGSGSIYAPHWETYALRYAGSAWSDLMYLPYSAGRKDMFPVGSTVKDQQLWLAWPTDNRDTGSYTTHQQGQVMIAPVSLEGTSQSQSVELQPYQEEPVKPFEPVHPNEVEELQRIRSYRIEGGERGYSIFRGDVHRHTDLSWDGGRDGSVLDAYRYARDAAGLDFLGVTDHNQDVEESYLWWLSQKFADLFQLQNFVAFYSYERSLEFPNGHRNVLFTRRGTPILPIMDSERNGWDGSGRLFHYLKRYNGTSIPHTSGTGAGTDWRDNDPEVEHLVEIYQGMRDTYEYPGSLRPKTLVPSPSLDEDNSPPRRFGTVWHALSKGYRLGFIASSDHISTHISYACLIAEELTLDSLMEAIRSRRAYAATDNLILDIRFTGSDGDHLMGEDFSSTIPVTIKAKILGTDTIQRVDIIKNNKIVYTTSSAQAELEFQYADQDQAPGESYYYLRVAQQDGEMAWGSPVWVNYEAK